MQTTDTKNTTTSTLLEELERFFTRIRQGLDACLETISRARELERLTLMSDEQLSRRGIRREDIVSHVFRDRFNV